EGEGEQAPKRHAIQADGGRNPETLLHIPAHEYRVRGLPAGKVLLGLKVHGAVDVRLAKDFAEPEREHSGEQSDEHAAHQERANGHLPPHSELVPGGRQTLPPPRTGRGADYRGRGRVSGRGGRADGGRRARTRARSYRR